MIKGLIQLIVLQSTREVRDLAHVPPTVKADNGEPGRNKNCFGKNAKHTIVKVVSLK